MEIAVRENNNIRPPSIYFSHEYGTATARNFGNDWRLISDTHGLWQIPLEFRNDLQYFADAATPYGYGGIYADQNLTFKELETAWSATLDTLRDREACSLFLRFAPFLDTDPMVLSNLPGLNIERASETISVSLSNEQEVWENMQGRARTSVRKALKNGLYGSVRSLSEEDIIEDSIFRQLYESTMSRVSANSFYTFSDQYYEHLLYLGPNRIHLAEVKDPSGEVGAAAIILQDEDVAHYHLSGSSPHMARMGANNLLLWSVIQWGIEHHLGAFHLGGGTRPNDRLFKFKQSFGGETLAYYVAKVIVNEDKYDFLVDQRARKLGCAVNDLTTNGYFPAYRVVL